MPQDEYALTRNIEKSTRLLYVELKREPTEKEIALDLNVTEFVIRKNIRYQFTEQSIDEYSSDDDQALEILDNSPIQQGYSIIKKEVTSEMRLAIKSIKTPVQQKIIKMLYGIKPYGKTYSVQETAQKLNCSGQTIRQSQKITLRQLKTYCIARGLDKV